MSPGSPSDFGRELETPFRNTVLVDVGNLLE
jgi:hypothetical protein